MSTRPNSDLPKQWRQTRFNPLRRATPRTLASDLDAFKAGYIRNAALLWDAIEGRDYMVRTAVGKRKKSLARRAWEILMVDDSPVAAQQKESLEWFFNNLTATDALDLNVRGSFRMMLKQMMDAEFKGYAVHEILWTRPLVPLPGGGRSMQAELRFVPLCLFENLTGKLRYTGPLAVTDGAPLEEGGWMVTTGDCLMEPISVAWMFKKLSLADWLNFSEKFGLPGIHGITNATKGSKEWDDFVEALKSFSSDWIMASATGSEVKLVEAGQTGEAPFKPMVDHMDRAIASICRGADLSTISAKNHAGASLQADESVLLESDDCEAISETLNEQLCKQVIYAIYGEDADVLAYIRIEPPVQKDTKMDIEVDDHLRDHGVPMSVEDMAERYGRTLPDDSETLTHSSQGGPPPPAPKYDRAAADNPDAGQANVSAEEQALREAVATDLLPVRARLTDVLQAGTDEEQRRRLDELMARWPQLIDAVLSGDSLEAAMNRVFSSAFLAGLQELSPQPVTLP